LREAQTHKNNKIYLFIRMVGLYFELLKLNKKKQKNFLYNKEM